MFSIIQILIAVATILTGLLALVKPSSAEGFIGLSARGARGRTEIRAVFGGLFIALGLMPLVSQFGGSYRMLGIAYLAIGIVRLASLLFIDKSTARSNLISLGIEALFALLLLL